MKILFIGDIVGPVGRRMVKEYLPHYIKKYDVDFVIANGENVTHGKGLIRHHYEELLDYGIDVITLGNHYNSKKELERYIDQTDRLIRPYNLIQNFPGEGTALFDVDGLTIRVSNILGSAFMKEEVNSPYYAIVEINNELEPCDIHIIDFHAEATGEKYSIGYAFDGKVGAVLGTHTHVQTNDAKIFPNGTAFISDVGMTGYEDGILGFDKDTVIKKNCFGEMSRFEVPKEGKGVFSAVLLDFDRITHVCRQIIPIRFVEDK